ncbi:MAG: glycosyltransferase family 4 protein [Anaerolineales bacterium]
MKIALLHYSAPPIIGGVESVLAQHARLMASAGHEVRVIAGRGGVFDRRIQFVSVPLLDSRHSTILDCKTQLDKGLIPQSFSLLTEEIAARLKPALTGVDLLIAHNVCSLHKNLPLTAALERIRHQPDSPKLVLWHHDLAWTSARYRGELHAGHPWDMLRRPWPGTTLVTISAFRRQELAQLLDIPADQIRVIPNGLDAARFLKLAAKTTELAGKLDLWNAAPLLLLPVRITKRKNLELALNAMAALLARLPEARLVITGPAGAHNPANQQYFADLKSLQSGLGLENSVAFLADLQPEGLPDEVVADLYRISDAVLLPSWEEGFGIPLIEAGFSGIPAFCSDIPSLRELGGSGVSYFPPGSAPQQVAALIADTLEGNPQYRQRSRMRRDYRWETIYARHLVPLLEEAQ